MSLEYPCVYYDNQKCKKFEEPGYVSWCVLGPCSHETPSKADHIRSMTDEELAKFPFLECPYIAEPYGECKYGWHDREQTCEECMLEWLKQPYKEET